MISLVRYALWAISRIRAMSAPLFRTIAPTKLASLEAIPPTFSPAEKVLWWFLVVCLFGSSFFVLNNLSAYTMTEVPDYGGNLTEGIVGAPRYVNPLLAISDADRDMTALVYSGLMRATPEGALIPDLAESYHVSEDGLAYTFTLRQNAYFHDGEPVTADDVILTVVRAQDPALKSPKRPNWDGVSVEKIDERTVRFTLRQPYAPFLENTTIGILPKHLWGNLTTEEFALSPLNTEPIGSGPLRVSSMSRAKSGTPENYALVPFTRYALGTPYLSQLNVHFYASEDALIAAWEAGDIESVSGVSFSRLSELLARNAHILTAPLPRVFALFMNQNQAPIFSHKEVREALDRALNKEQIVEEVLAGYGSVIKSPIPPGIPGYQSVAEEKTDEKTAADILTEAGWNKNSESGIWEKASSKKGQPQETLAFSLSTSNAPELKAAAELVQKQLRAFGANVDLKIFETSDLNQNAIRPRKYDALLFGEIVGRDLDFFAFWHSSQRNDPGLNVALYTNSDADKLLESGRATADLKKRLETYRAFEKKVADDVGAIFLYTPDFIYIIPPRFKRVKLGLVTTPSERFANVYEWHVETNRVWNVLVPINTNAQ